MRGELAALLERDGQSDDAARELAAASDRDPGGYVWHEQLAALSQASGDLTRACSEYHAALVRTSESKVRTRILARSRGCPNIGPPVLRDAAIP